MCFVLIIKGFLVVSKLEVSLCNGLITTGHLDVLFSEEVHVYEQTLSEAINGSLVILTVLIHES